MEDREDYERCISSSKAYGKMEGLKEGAFLTLVSLVKQGLLPLDIAAQQSGITSEEFSKRISEMEKKSLRSQLNVPDKVQDDW